MGGGYRKELGLWHLVWLAVGAILGPAVAFVPIYVLAYGGPAGLAAWPIAFLMLVPPALVFAELGTMWPRAGGVAYYPAKSNGSLVGVLNGWGAFLGYALIVPAASAMIAETLAYYFPQLYSVHEQRLTLLGVLVALLIALLAFAVDSLRVIVLGNVNYALTVVKIVLVLAAMAALLAFFDPRNLSNPSYGGFAPYGAAGVFIATTATIFGYLGFRQPVDYAEEARDPARDIPRAILVALAIVLVFYAVQSLAFLGVVDHWSAFNVTPGNWSALGNLPAPYPEAASAVRLPAAAAAFVAGAAIAGVTDALIYMGGAARVGNALARLDNYFPEFFARLNRFGVPFNSLVVVLVVGLVYLLLLPSFMSVMLIFTDAVLVSYAPAAVSLLAFRRAYPDEPRPFRLPAAEALAPLAFGFTSLLIYWSGFQTVLIVVASTLAGLLALPYVYYRKRALSARDVRGGLWFVAYLLATLAMSYAGSSQFGGRNLIPFPYDTVAYFLASLGFFYWGYRSALEYLGVGRRA